MILISKFSNWKIAIPVTLIVFLIFAEPITIWMLTKPLHSSISSDKEDSIKNAALDGIKAIDAKLTKLQPKSGYLIINSTANEFYLFKEHKLLKQEKCSTGSYIILKNGDKQQWMFKTPKGEFKILGKTKNPVWKKPDWAFIEEGQSVPSMNHSSRFEYGVLGDYSLSLGDGYLIHGTLYQRFIGLPVTHGCVRLNKENLELVYKNLVIGSKVYLF